MGSPTPKMNMTLPTVGGDSGTWGTELNGNFSIIDNLAGYNVVSTSITGALTVGIGPTLVKATAGAGGITLTLPDATLAANSGRVFIVVKVDAAVGVITINTTSAQTINGLATASITTQWGRIGVQSDGANWILLDSLSASQTGTGSTVLSSGATLTGLINEFSATGITAFAGGGQASATLLTGQTNRITTVATAGDSVKLPPAVAGLEITVVNATNNYMGVFGSGTDTINGQAAATGIFQPANSVDIYVCSAAGLWNAEVGVGFSGSLFTEFAQDNITAHAGGGQASATQLIAQTSRVTTVATAGDSIKLPPSAPGIELVLINHGANAMQVFGSGTDSIDDAAAATGVSQMPSSFVIYSCVTAGQWYTEGLANGFGGGLQTVSTLDAITALGTNQGTATVLPPRMAYNVTTTPAGTGILLPPSVTGAEIAVNNLGANALLVYPNGTETINQGAASVASSVAINTVIIFYCFTGGKWYTK